MPNQRRNSSGDEIANVNFLYDDIVHVLQNITPSKVIQGHRFWYISKAHMRLPISD